MGTLAANWPTSILLAASLVDIAVFIELVSDGAAKYRRNDREGPRSGRLPGGAGAGGDASGAVAPDAGRQMIEAIGAPSAGARHRGTGRAPGGAGSGERLVSVIKPAPNFVCAWEPLPEDRQVET
jgi:hypothetical protein